jgi:hypothetical protein
MLRSLCSYPMLAASVAGCSSFVAGSRTVAFVTKSLRPVGPVVVAVTAHHAHHEHHAQRTEQDQAKPEGLRHRHLEDENGRQLPTGSGSIGP